VGAGASVLFDTTTGDSEYGTAGERSPDMGAWQEQRATATESNPKRKCIRLIE
jgi:hypothetical protein